MNKKVGKSNKTIRPGKGVIASEMESFVAKASKAIRESAGNLTIDCSRTRAMDAIGMAILLRAHASCREAGGSLRLVHVGDPIVDMFRHLGLEKDFQIEAKHAGNG